MRHRTTKGAFRESGVISKRASCPPLLPAFAPNDIAFRFICQLIIVTSRIFDTTHARDGGHRGVRPGRRASARTRPCACFACRAREPARAGSGPRATGRDAVETRCRGADFASRDEKGWPGVLSRGGQEVQRGPSEEIRDVPFRGRGPLVRAWPRRLRRALRGTRIRHRDRCHPLRLNSASEKKKWRSRRGRVEK